MMADDFLTRRDDLSRITHATTHVKLRVRLRGASGSSGSRTCRSPRGEGLAPRKVLAVTGGGAVGPMRSRHRNHSIVAKGTMIPPRRTVASARSETPGTR